MSAPVTSRHGLEIGGVPPTEGSAGVDEPLHPVTPKALDGFAATTAALNLWSIDEQGATYDGFEETRVTGMVIVPNSTTGIIQRQCFGQRVAVNAFGVVTKKGEITLLWAISFTGTVINATVAVPAFP